VIERGELRLSEALDNGQHGRVYESDVGIRIAVAELEDSTVVLGLQVFHSIRSGHDVIEKSNEEPGMQPVLDQVVHFYEDGSRNDKRFIDRFEKCAASRVIDVAAVERRVYWPGV
jgi:hypothetical protein